MATARDPEFLQDDLVARTLHTVDVFAHHNVDDFSFGNVFGSTRHGHVCLVRHAVVNEPFDELRQARDPRVRRELQSFASERGHSF